MLQDSSVHLTGTVLQILYAQIISFVILHQSVIQPGIVLVGLGALMEFAKRDD